MQGSERLASVARGLERAEGVAMGEGVGPLASLRWGLPWLIAFAMGCTFEGYTPKGPPPAPLAPSEARIADLALGDQVTGALDCPAGNCRVRYRIIVPESGDLTVTVDGPGGGGEQGDVGPRLARAVLEGVGQQTLATRARAAGPPPYVVESSVQGGVHYILVQGLGGPLEYTVAARFEPRAQAVTEPNTELALSDPGQKQKKQRGLLRQPVERTVVPLPRHAPGDISDGADYAADPNFDILKVRRYAFAQDPAKMLEGKPGSDAGSPFLLRQIQRDIRYVLADNGFVQVEAKDADFLIAVGVGSKSTTWWSFDVAGFTEPYDYYFNLWDRTGVGIAQHTYQDGTLMIDFIQPGTGKLLWHGWTIESIPISGDENKAIKKAVAKVLGQV